MSEPTFLDVWSIVMGAGDGEMLVFTSRGRYRFFTGRDMGDENDYLTPAYAIVAPLAPDPVVEELVFARREMMRGTIFERMYP